MYLLYLPALKSTPRRSSSRDRLHDPRPAATAAAEMSGLDLSSLLLRAGREGAQMRRLPRGPVMRAPDLDDSPRPSGASASMSQATLAACLVLASASVVLHAYARIFRLRPAYWEDCKLGQKRLFLFLKKN